MQTFYGENGSADIVQVHAALLQARVRLRMLAGENMPSPPKDRERESSLRAPGKRVSGQRAPCSSDPKPAA